VKAKLTASRSSSPVGIIGIEAFMGDNWKTKFLTDHSCRVGLVDLIIKKKRQKCWKFGLNLQMQSTGCNFLYAFSTFFFIKYTSTQKSCILSGSCKQFSSCSQFCYQVSEKVAEKLSWYSVCLAVLSSYLVSAPPGRFFPLSYSTGDEEMENSDGCCTVWIWLNECMCQNIKK
jgi:hypothetical protein